MAKVICRTGKVAVKTIMVLVLILCFVKVFAFAQTGEGLPVNQAVVALEEAFAHRLAENFKQAEQDYIQIIQQYPDSDYAFAAQKGLTISYIAWGKPTQGQAALQELMADDIDDQQMASALRDVADHYRWFNDPKTALELYQYVIDNHPQGEEAMWSQVGIVILDISKGDYDAADAAVDKLVNGYYGHEKVADAVYEVAELYRDQQKQQKAYSLYRYVMDNWPNLDGAMWSQMRVSLISIEQEDYEVAQTAVNRLLADYLDHEKIVDAAHQIADLYRRQQKHQEAHSLYQYIVDNLPDKEIAFWTLEEAFDYRLDKDFEQAERIYTQLIQQYPDSEYAFAAQKGLTISYIASGKPTQAQTALQELMSYDADDQQMASTLREVADHYRWFENPKAAIELYQYVVDNQPQEDGAMWSQMGIAMCNILQGDYDAADAAVDKLVSDYYGHEKVADAVYQVAELYRDQQKPQKAYSLYRYVLDNWPDLDVAMWSQMRVAMISIQQEDYEGAQTAANRLLADFSGHDDIAKIFYEMADSCSKRDETKARQLFQQLMDTWPESVWSAVGRLQVSILDGDNTGLQAALNSLLAGGVSSYDKVVEVIFSVANKHYNAFSNENRTVQADKRLRNAMEICDILLKEVPQFNPAWIGPEACTLIAESYRRFGEYDKALPYYEKILIDWPLNMYAKNAKFMVGRCYEALKKSGMIDAYTADNETEFAYEQLLQRDPNHPAAGYMSNWLTRYEDELQGNEWK